MRLRIAGCVFDSEARTLERAGQAVPLSPKAFQLLSLLLERRPSAVSHGVLHDLLWPDVAVGYTSLPQVVAELRRALGDNARAPRWIRTVTRFGYAFAGGATEETSFSPATIVGALVAGRMEHAIGAGVTLIGRGSDCDLPLHAAGVSREHARIVATRDAITIEDAGSKNGTWINGTRRTGACVLKDGDEVCFGSCRTVFRAAGPDATTRTLTVTSSSRPGTTAPPVR